MGKLILVAALVFGLTSMLMEVVHNVESVPRGTAEIDAAEVTHAFEVGYIHGKHCMDSRIF